MTKTSRGAARAALVAGVLPCTIAVLACTSGAGVRQLSVGTADPSSLVGLDARVRGSTSRLAAIIASAHAHSETFRGLVEQIGATDGLVYVTEGKCGQLLRACLLHRVTAAGIYRVLWITVEPRHSELEVMASIGHELQHVIEVLANRTIRSDEGIRLMYHMKCQLCRQVFETDAAVLAGRAVREELESSAAAARRDR